MIILNATDYFSYGKILREYDGGSGDRYMTTSHERDPETGLDYRGARYYDSDIARFLSLDPLAVKYPMLSAYCYVGGMPIIAVDPDGKDIIIKTGKETSITYTPGMQVPKDASTQVQDIIMGLNHMHANIPEAQEKINYLVGLTDQGVNIIPTGNFGDVNKFFPPSNSDPTHGDLYFNPNQADQMQDGGSQSPIVGLAHELQHAYNYFDAYNSYDNAETKGEIKRAEDKISRVNDRDYEEHRTSTTGLEPTVAKYYNNATRSGHQTPIGIFYVGCVTCTTPSAPSSEGAKKQIENVNKAFK